MRLKTIIILLLTGIMPALYAQTDSSATKFRYENLSFNGSYYGETVWYPGLKFGAEYIIREKKKYKEKHSKKKGDFTKTKTNQFIVTANLGFYWQPHNYSSPFINSAVLYRRTANKGFQYNFGLSLVGVNAFFFNETYKVSDDGEVSKAFLPVRLFYSPSIIMGLGHTMKGKTLTAWYVNLHLTALMPYNNAVNALAALEFGFRFNIKKFNK